MAGSREVGRSSMASKRLIVSKGSMGDRSIKTTTGKRKATMRIIEQIVIGKKSQEECEDGIIVTDSFAAVIDGSTSKTNIRIADRLRQGGEGQGGEGVAGEESIALSLASEGTSNGRLAMLLVKDFIRQMPADISVQDFCRGVTEYINKVYRIAGLDISHLQQHPIERLTASCAIYSAHRQQVWMVGDCQVVVGQQGNCQCYNNPKPQEAIYDHKRAEVLRRMLANGDATIDSVRTNDPGRAAVLPDIIDSCNYQNRSGNGGYSVIDGFTIPLDKVRIIDIPQKADANTNHNTDLNVNTSTTLILASDGYPTVLPTLTATEQHLQAIIAHDPLLIHDFLATKAVMKGQKSFDDRSYLRLSV